METPPAAAAVCPRRPAPARRRVRVVGKIMDHSGVEAEKESSTSSSKGISVSVLKQEGEASKHAMVIFRDLNGDAGCRESYKLDWCYEVSEDVGKLFTEEVKPIIQSIFHGEDASVIAFGAKGSGKTLLIEGCEEKPGLAPLAAAEILTMCSRNSTSLMISCYEISQDRIFDVLERKEQEVQVLEDACGRTQLKGLSQKCVKSISDFNKLYLTDFKPQTSCQKAPSDFTIRRHKGLIIYLCDGESLSCIGGRLHFVDLAGYEDSTHKNNDCPLIRERTRANKSLYALQNVICALNSSERHVPYRGCKLTHVLKDSISGAKSQTLMITCLKPSPCQGTIRAVAMASSSCTATSVLLHDSGKKSKTVALPTQPRSPLASRSMLSSASSKTNRVSRFTMPDKKLDATTSITKGRKLFGIGSLMAKSVEKLNLAEKPSSDIILDAKCLDQDKENLIEASENFSYFKDLGGNKEEHEHEENRSRSSNGGMGDTCEFKCTNQEESPPISQRLREIANSLKLLSCPPIDAATDGIVSFTNKACELTEPKTPVPFSNLRSDDYENCELSFTPWEIFKTRSNGLKECLAKELLTYINCATKDELMKLKGIGEKRANLILELREESPQPFKDMNDLRDIGISSKQVKEMMKCILGDFYT